MAVTPKEAMKLNADRDQIEVNRLEKTLDRYLKDNYDGEPLYINTEYPNAKVFRELQRRYNAAGWTVKLQDDQREGTYFIFREARR